MIFCSLAAACFSGAITVYDAALRQIVWREFHVDTVAGKNFDVMTAQAAGDVREDDVPVVEFDGKRGARKNLFDAAVDFQRRLFGVLGRCRFGSTGIHIASVASSDNGVSFRRISGGVWR